MPDQTQWFPSPSVLKLGPDEVHVWRADLNVPAERLEPLHALLSSEERERAARFHFEKDRRHYTAARGILRSLLSDYLSVQAGQIVFTYNKYGKPELDLGATGGSLRFNLSHSHGLALFGFTRDRDLGIDLELIRPERATDEIAERFFAAAETAVLRSLPKEIRSRAFFDCWTRKEAFIKARGLGLSLPLHSFVVSLAPGERPALLSLQSDPQAPARWSLRDLDVAENYAAALAVEGAAWRLRCWEVAL